jgi:DNA-binding transcriptional regulator of glucitol operon
MFWDIVIIAGIFWIIMSIFSFIQSVQIKNIFKILEPSGQVYFGRDAGFLRTKYIAFAAVNPDGTVINAKLLKACRIVTAAKIQPMDDLIDKNLLTLEPAAMDLEAKKELAIQNLSSNYKKYAKRKKQK